MSNNESEQTQQPLESEIDLIELLSTLLKSWKLISGITVLIAISSFFAIKTILPTEYEASVVIGLPELEDLSSIKNNSIISATSKDIFARTYKELRTQDNYKKFLQENNYLTKLFPTSQLSQENQLRLAYEDLNFTTLEPLPSKDKKAALADPETVKISLSNIDQALCANILTKYVLYITQLVNKKARLEFTTSKNISLAKIERDIDILLKNTR